MRFDITAYLVIGSLLTVLLGTLLYMRPPGWRFFSGVELVFIIFALIGCVTPQPFMTLLITEVVWLFLATICFVLAMFGRKKVRNLEEVPKPPMATTQFRWLAVAYFAVAGRLMLTPLLAHMFR